MAANEAVYTLITIALCGLFFLQFSCNKTDRETNSEKECYKLITNISAQDKLTTIEKMEVDVDNKGQLGILESVIYSDKDPFVRGAALAKLVNHFERESISILRRSLLHFDSSIQLLSIFFVYKYKLQELSPTLVNIAKTSPPAVSAFAIEILGNWKDKSLIPMFIGLLGDDSPLIRKAAINALFEFKSSNQSPAILRMTGDVNVGVRLACYEYLFIQNNEELIGVFLKALVKSRKGIEIAYLSFYLYKLTKLQIFASIILTTDINEYEKKILVDKIMNSEQGG